MRKKRFDIGLLVDPFDADRPMPGAEIARVPREASRTMLLKFVPQRARIVLFGKLKNTAEQKLVEILENDPASVGLRQGAAVERDRGGSEVGAISAFF